MIILAIQSYDQSCQPGAVQSENQGHHVESWAGVNKEHPDVLTSS